MGKIWKMLVTVIYTIGVAIMFILLAYVAFQSHIVLFPDAMLPMELRDLATIWLMFGSIPMMIFSVLFYKVHDISKSSHRIRNTILTYIPAAVCLICALFWICVWVIGMINMIYRLSFLHVVSLYHMRSVVNSIPALVLMPVVYWVYKKC